MEEIWKDIPEYEGLYQVSNQGRVKSLYNFHNKGVIYLKNNLTKTGYYQVSLSKHGNKQRFKVHRLVAMTFIPNPNKLPQINHKNEIKTDNRVENLEWCNQIYNCNYGTRLERAARSIGRKVICLETGKEFWSGAEAARQMNLDISHIAKCCRGELEHIKGYHFKRIN